MNKTNKENQSKTTIIDVARYSGVSVATVSRVINNKSDVRDETCNRVLQSIIELNYVPNTAARSLKKGKDGLNNEKTNNAVGLIAYESIRSSPYFIHILNGVEHELTSNGFNCIYSQIRDKRLQNLETANEYHLIKLLTKGEFDGIIAVSIIDNKLAELFKKSKLPLVLIDSNDFGDDIDYVNADNKGGARKAISYLISIGHKRIAFLRECGDSWFFNDLEEGYIQALTENSMLYDPSLVKSAENIIEEVFIIIDELLGMEDPPTAIFTNDITAIMLMNAVKEKGLKVPEDISIMGFDDIDAASYLNSSLTTVQVPKNEIGAIAARRIIEHIKSKSNLIPMRSVLGTKLVIRKSTAVRGERKISNLKT